jgi:hypothetical protein
LIDLLWEGFSPKVCISQPTKLRVAPKRIPVAHNCKIAMSILGANPIMQPKNCPKKKPPTIDAKTHPKPTANK